MTESTSQWAIIADDLTGACDTGAVFAQRGFLTVVLPNLRAAVPRNAQVVVLSTNSRNDSIREARQKVRQWCRRLATVGARILYKKIDSTLKGHVPAEIESVMQTAGFSRVVVCPAFPAQGRVVLRGVLFVRGQPLADLSRRFHSLRRLRIARVVRPISAVKIIQRLRRDSVCVIPDATTNQDLCRLVKAAKNAGEPVLLVGSAGMARHLAETLRNSQRNVGPRQRLGARQSSAAFDPRATSKSTTGLAHSKTWRSKAGSREDIVEWRASPEHRAARRAMLRALKPNASPLIFAGSRNAVTEAQIECLVRRRQALVRSLDALNAAGLDALRAQGPPGVLRVPMHQLPVARLTRRLASLDDLFSRQQIHSLVLIGGDTAGLITRWLGAKAIELRGEIAPGIPWGHLCGGKADGIVVCTKAGGFGEANTLIQVVDFLSPRSQNAAIAD